MELERLLAVIAAFNREGVEYILVGGAALNVHGIIRATEDVDFFVRPDPENVDRLRRALRSIWDDPELDSLTSEDLSGQYPTVRYGPPDDDLVIDLLSRLGTEFSFADLESETIEVQGVPIRIATPHTLYRMKRDTIRPQDRTDALALRTRFQLKE